MNAQPGTVIDEVDQLLTAVVEAARAQGIVESAFGRREFTESGLSVAVRLTDGRDAAITVDVG